MPKVFPILCVSLLLVACASVTVDQNANQKIKNYNAIVRPAKDVIDPVHGKETGFWYGAMSGVNGTNANGVVFMHGYSDGAYAVTLNLNILPAKKGWHFVADLRGADSAQVLSIGTLVSIVGDARHSVKLETTTDAHALLTVSVFLVADSGRAAEAQLVASGTLKQPPMSH